MYVAGLRSAVFARQVTENLILAQTPKLFLFNSDFVA